MKKLVLLTTLAAFSLVSGVAGAVTLKNTDKGVAIVAVTVGGQKDTVKIVQDTMFDTKGKDASFTLGSGPAVAAKGNDKLVISGGKIKPADVTPAKDKAAATDAKQPVATPTTTR